MFEYFLYDVFDLIKEGGPVPIWMSNFRKELCRIRFRIYGDTMTQALFLKNMIIREWKHQRHRGGTRLRSRQQYWPENVHCKSK